MELLYLVSVYLFSHPAMLTLGRASVHTERYRDDWTGWIVKECVRIYRQHSEMCIS